MSGTRIKICDFFSFTCSDEKCQERYQQLSDDHENTDKRLEILEMDFSELDKSKRWSDQKLWRSRRRVKGLKQSNKQLKRAVKKWKLKKSKIIKQQRTVADQTEHLKVLQKFHKQRQRRWVRKVKIAQRQRRWVRKGKIGQRQRKLKKQRQRKLKWRHKKASNMNVLDWKIESLSAQMTLQIQILL